MKNRDWFPASQRSGKERTPRKKRRKAGERGGGGGGGRLFEKIERQGNRGKLNERGGKNRAGREEERGR